MTELDELKLKVEKALVILVGVTQSLANIEIKQEEILEQLDNLTFGGEEGYDDY